MNKRLKSVLSLGLAALMIVGTDAYVSNVNDAEASVNPYNYGVDIFPSRQTHNQFAYQLRSRGHNSRVYYANRYSKFGRTIFGKGVPNIDYANYMSRHHHKLFRSITNQIERNRSYKKWSHQGRVRRRTIRRKRMNSYNHKIRKIDRYKKVRHGQQSLKSRFRRSNNQQALKRSGFFDAHMIGGNFIFDKYAPNDKRAVVPKRTNVNDWYKGKFGQRNPTAYQYVPKYHDWKILKY